VYVYVYFCTWTICRYLNIKQHSTPNVRRVHRTFVEAKKMPLRFYGNNIIQLII